MGKDSVLRQCFQKCWAAIISSELMEGPYSESISFPLLVYSVSSHCVDLNPYSTEMPQICRPPLPHLSLSLLGPITRPGVQR
jgi:hypothetical protein